jgi:hypothetical protein
MFSPWNFPAILGYSCPRRILVIEDEQPENWPATMSSEQFSSPDALKIPVTTPSSDRRPPPPQDERPPVPS